MFCGFPLQVIIADCKKLVRQCSVIPCTFISNGFRLLPADAGGYCQGNPATRLAARMFCAHCGGAATDQFRTRQTQVQRLSAAEQSACELQVRGRGVQHYDGGSCGLPPRLCRPYDRNRAVAGRTVHVHPGTMEEARNKSDQFEKAGYPG